MSRLLASFFVFLSGAAAGLSAGALMVQSGVPPLAVTGGALAGSVAVFLISRALFRRTACR